MIFGFDLISAILLVFCLVLITHRLVLFHRLPPGPYGLPFFGYSVYIDPKAPYKTLEKLSEKYGKIFCLNIGSVRVVCLTDYKLIKTAFAKDIYSGRPPLPVTHGIMKGYGILGSEGPWWSEQRRFLTQSLRHLGANRKNIDKSKMEAKMMAEVDDVMTQLKSHSNGSPFSCDRLLSHAFGNIITQLIFGCRFETGHVEFTRQLELLDEGFKAVDVMGTINFFPFLRFVPHFRGKFKKLLNNQSEHHEFLKRQIDQHKNTLDLDKPRDYLDLFLIQMSRSDQSISFNDTQLIHSLADCFGAGIETSKVTFQWLLLYLMTNLDVQEKMRDEINKIIGGREIKLSDAILLPYTEAVIMEGQRLANLVPLGAPHGTVKNSVLEGHFIPSGTMMVALLWSVHMDPKLWRDPERFDPGRFLDATGRVVKTEFFMPFSVGRRVCPGEDLAKMEIFLFLSNIVRKYRILPCGSPNLERQMGFTLTPIPYKLRLVPIEDVL